MGPLCLVLVRFLRRDFVPNAELSVVSRREVLLTDMVLGKWTVCCEGRPCSLGWRFTHDRGYLFAGLLINKALACGSNFREVFIGSTLSHVIVVQRLHDTVNHVNGSVG